MYDIDNPSASLDLHDFIGYAECKWFACSLYSNNWIKQKSEGGDLSGIRVAFKYMCVAMYGIKGDAM